MHYSPTKKAPIIIFDVPSDTEGREVIAAAAEQASVEVESISVKFPTGGKDLTYWGIDCASSPFHKLLGLRRLVIGWSMSKIGKHLRARQFYKCSRCGHISSSCRKREACLECGSAKHNAAN